MMTVASRTSGIAPLGVVFDAIDTTNTGLTQPFVWTSGVYQPPDYEDCTYVWDFGDPASGTFTWTGNSRNTAVGYVAAHVYNNPGTYTVTLTITDTSGVTHTDTEQITVSAFSGTTYYVAANGNDGNPGTQALPFLTAAKGFSMAATNTAILFRRGDTFAMPAAKNISVAGPGIVGAYGTGDRPIFSTAATSEPHLMVGTDWRVMDIQLIGPTLASSGTGLGLHISTKCQFPLFHRVYVQGWWVGIGWSDYAQTDSDPHEGVVISECETNGGGYGMYVAGRRVGVIGGYHHDAYQTHLIRMYVGTKCVISNNKIYDPGPTRHCIKLCSNNVSSNTYLTKYVAINDNLFRGKTWSVAVANEDEGSNEPVNNIQIERNKFVGEASIQTDLFIGASNTVSRNNVLNGTGCYYGYTGIWITWRGTLVPRPTNNRVLNNTVARTDLTGQPSGQQHEFTGVRIDSNSINTVVRNNLTSTPTTGVAVSGTGTNPTISNNLFTTSPGFANAGAGDFALTAGSLAVNAGAALPEVRYDFLGLPRPAGVAYDIGAYEYGATAVTYSETDIPLSGTTPVRLDLIPLAARTIIRIINPDQTNRVFIGHSQVACTSNAEAAGGPTGAVYEDLLGPGVQLWAVSENGAAITIRLKQWS